MYAVMFYVILNKRKLHFPLAKNVMHSPSYNATHSKKMLFSAIFTGGLKFWFFEKNLGGKCLFNVVNGACMFTAPISSLYV